MQVLNWFFKSKNEESNPSSARGRARDRMRLMLVHDRLELPPDRLAALEEELVAVVGRYFEIERESTRFDLQQYERKAALIANFPLLRSK